MNGVALLRCVVWFVCLYSIGFGLLLNGPDAWVAVVAERMLNYGQEIDAPLRFTGRMLGAYMMFFGVALGLVAWNPVKNRAVLTVAVLLLLCRILQRLVYAGQLESIFGISSQRNWTYIGILAVFAVAMAAYRVTLHRQINADVSSAT
jgi:hypothetical protein